ncbi:MAG: hypothetical protein ABR600_12255 [Actinomycetota bacterium]
MSREDPFAGLDADLDYEHVSDDVVELAVGPSALPPDEAEMRFLVSMGLFDMLAEAAMQRPSTDEERFDALLGVLGRFTAIEPTLRYWLYDRGRQAEQQELVTRMRGREIAVTREWMIPRLREDIEDYRSRIDALRERLDRA